MVVVVAAHGPCGRGYVGRGGVQGGALQAGAEAELWILSFPFAEDTHDTDTGHPPEAPGKNTNSVKYMGKLCQIHGNAVSMWEIPLSNECFLK